MTSVSMENVPGLLYVKKHENYIKTFASALIGIGMDVQIQVLDSSRYGDPQKRSRVFLTAFKINLRRFIFPIETHGPDDNCKTIVTVFDVLDDLTKLDPTKGNGLVEKLEKDGAFIYIQNHCKRGTEMKSEVEKLKRNDPAHTIRRKGNVQHYDDRLNRTLTVRELLRLQSFSDDFAMSGTLTQQIDGIGNAVPVKTATAVAKAILLCHNSPMLKEKMKVRIVSKANIRQDYRMYEQGMVLGELREGDVREFVATKLLHPLVRNDYCQKDGGNIGEETDVYDETDVDVVVKRYQIKLLSQDAGNEGTVREGSLGWISDRSRLKDDPFMIAEEV